MIANRTRRKQKRPDKLYTPYRIPYLETNERNDWCYRHGYDYDPGYGIKVIRPRKTNCRELTAATFLVTVLTVAFLMFCSGVGFAGGRALSKTSFGKAIYTSTQSVSKMETPWDVDAMSDADSTVPQYTKEGYKVSGSSEFSRFIAYSLYNHEYRLDITAYADQPDCPSMQDVINDALHQNPLLLISDCEYNYGTYDGKTSIELEPIGMLGGDELVDMYRRQLDDRADFLLERHVDTGASAGSIAYQIDCALSVECEYDDKAADYADLVNSGKKSVEDYVDEFPYSWNAYGALYNGYALCEGYANGYKLLCDKAGIECMSVSGSYDGTPHAWNIVNDGTGSWYLVDPTFDDDGDQCGGEYCMASVTEQEGDGKNKRTYDETYTLDGVLAKMGLPDFLIDDWE